MTTANIPRSPWEAATNRRLAVVDVLTHLDDLVRIVLLTSPGERLHRPGFGAGLGVAALFEPLNGDVASTVTARARGSLTEALGDRLVVMGVEVSVADTTIYAQVSYRPLPAGAERTVLLELPVPGGTA